MYQGGSSRKQGPRLAIREKDDDPPMEAYVRPCEWPSEEFVVKASIKDEFDAYVHNADLEDFMQYKCPQYYHLTDSFVRRFKFTSSRNSQNVMFDLYDKSYIMDLEDLITSCKLVQWGSVNEPRKSEYKYFLDSITVGESREIAQATIGSIHFPAIHYFALFIGICINGKDEACHKCVPDLSVLRSAVLGDKQYNLGANVTRRLHNNGLIGDLFGGIYATPVANYLGVPIMEATWSCLRLIYIIVP